MFQFLIRLYSYRLICAGALLIVFLLGITPKRVLHDFVANHKDAISTELTKNNTGQKASFSNSGYHCHVDDLVVEGLFLHTTGEFQLKQPLFYNEHPSQPYYINLLLLNHISRLRGPPLNYSVYSKEQKAI